MPQTLTGGCACARVRFTAEVPDFKAYLCHCRMCQRASGNVSLAMVTLPQANVRWEGEPDWFDGSPIAERPFCAKCGTSLGFRFKQDSDKMDLTVAAFDDPERPRRAVLVEVELLDRRHGLGLHLRHRHQRAQRQRQYGALQTLHRQLSPVIS